MKPKKAENSDHDSSQVVKSKEDVQFVTSQADQNTSTKAEKSTSEEKGVPSFISPAPTFEVSQVPTSPPNPDTVLVVGAASRLGKNIVWHLIQKPGCIVLACVSSLTEFQESGLSKIISSEAQCQQERNIGIRHAAVLPLVCDLSQPAAIAQAALKKGVGAVICVPSGTGNEPVSEVHNGRVRALVSELEPVLGAQADGSEFRLFDFKRDGAAALGAFRSVDDRVMGGISSSLMRLSVDGTTASFCGKVTTEQNGGFAQNRGSFGVEDGQARRVDVSSYDGVAIRCRGDGRRYKINLKDEERPEVTFQTSFGTTDGEWQVVRVPFASFLPVRKGQLAYRDQPGNEIYQKRFDASNFMSIGILVSKIEPGGIPTPGYVSGDFELEISYIATYRACKPRFLLISSAAVTRPYWDKQKIMLAPRSVDIPIVKLNPSNILGHKLAGENSLRRSDIPWTIVRPVGLNDEVPAGQKLVVMQGDLLTGIVNRQDIARGVVCALRSLASTWKTFEMGVLSEQEENGKGLNDAEFAIYDLDALEAPYSRESDALPVSC